jgi:hypothetical protein
MRYIDEFRDREKARILIREIENLVATIARALPTISMVASRRMWL